MKQSLETEHTAYYLQLGEHLEVKFWKSSQNFSYNQQMPGCKKMLSRAKTLEKKCLHSNFGHCKLFLKTT